MLASSARRSTIGRRACAAGVVALLAAAVAGCGGDDLASASRSSPARAAEPPPPAPAPAAASREAFEPARGAPAPYLRPMTITTRGAFAFRAAADAGHVVWITGPVEEGAVQPALVQRELRTRRTTTLERGVDPSYGVASTAGWVVYARTAGATRLLAVRHDGSRRIELSASLVAPLATRGERVAWVERNGRADHVVVRDMSSGARWVAAVMPRCRAGRCHRVDSVALADRGVVFTRVATDPDTSEIHLRAFSARRPQRVSIPRDPQPELVPSSAGALYYVLGRGWHRWDFGRARPRRTPFGADPPAPLLGYERGRWFLLTRRGCRTGVAVQRGARRWSIGSPSALTARAGASGDRVCVQLGALTWTGRQPVTSWGVEPEESEEAHEEHGLVGLVAVGRPRH